MSVPALDPAELRRRCDPAGLGFETTAALEDLPELPGQERALAALRFGVGLRAHDYNVFAVGPTGLGKHAVVRALLDERARGEPVPDDWCYVADFADRHAPRPLRLPAGRAVELRKGMDALVPELRAALRAALESEQFRLRSGEIMAEAARSHEAAIEAVEQEANRRGIGLERTPDGFSLGPLRAGKQLSPEEYRALPEAERQQVARDLRLVHEKLEALLQEAARWAREARAKGRALVEDVSRGVVHQVLEEVRARFAGLPDVAAFLDDVERDLIDHADDLIAPPGERDDDVPELPLARRYRVNVLTDHAGASGAPVVYEDHPTYANLFGRVEHVQVLGALLTDFNLIKPGALHRANGGYLVLDALQTVQQPFVWDALKRSLKARELRIQSPAESLGLPSSTVALDPRPIPLEVKVVLVGSRAVHELLGALDPELRELFKVQADFVDDQPWTAATQAAFVRVLATITRRERVRPLDASAAARLVEDAARRAGDRQRLSLDLQAASDVVREADGWAAAAGDAVVRAAHVQRAIDERVRRADRVRDEAHERIARGSVLIDVTGRAVGQVNGLSVWRAGDQWFGRPVRITARARLGRGQVIDVEREVELGGPIHSKGVLILEGYLGARYAAEAPLSLSATLVFEQSYVGVEGDSASLAELCCLLSALAEAPLRQDVAMTGSVNQHGQVQPVGAVNEKVEGFFDVCRRIQLTGAQGVIVPRANLDALMLRQDVVDAAAAGVFRVWAVSTVDDALEVLTGLPAGEVHHRVQARLQALTEAARAFSPGQEGACAV